MLWTIVVILLILALVGSPNLGYWNHGYGWGLPGGLGLVILILVILLLTGHL